jgi:hypothetical protein
MLDLVDTDDWISWFIWDNECGKKEFEAGYLEMKKICNIDDLLELINSKP